MTIGYGVIVSSYALVDISARNNELSEFLIDKKEIS